MLQRAASNAYSWWWASHIRSKQSKWLDNNLQEMDERVKSMLEIIEEDADSFSRRAEMYFKRRPEMLTFVEDTYRSYRSLAERYDHISGELHKANHTIATAFPDQVQYAMLEEEDENFPKAITPINPKKIHKPTVEGLVSRIRGEGAQSPIKKVRRGSRAPLDKEKAEEEMDRLQKVILVLQTQKEFLKSSYEGGIAKYWEIEKKIADVQEEVYRLQDECGGASAVIQDDEARALMTATALKSCEDAVFSLQEQLNKSVEEERAELERIRSVRENLKVLGCEFGRHLSEITAVSDEDSSSGCSFTRENIEVQLLCAKVYEYFETNPNASVEETAEELDELVNRITTLELAVSTLFAQISRLRSENDELETYLQNLKEEEKIFISDHSDQVTDELKQAEEQLKRAENLEKNLQDEEIILGKSFYEVYNTFIDLLEKLQQAPPQKEDLLSASEAIDNEISSSNEMTEREDKEATEIHDTEGNSGEEIHAAQELSGDCAAKIPNKENEGASQAQSCPATHLGEEETSAELYRLLFNSLEGREKILLAEYTSILRRYKETKKELCEVLEKKNEDHESELMALVKGLKNANCTKDEEIRSLKQQLGSSKIKSNGNVDDPSEGKGQFYGHRRICNKSWLPAFCEEDSNLPCYQETYDVLQQVDEPTNTSSVEERFRKDIDELLEENLEFWLSFSATFHQTQEMQSKFDYLQTRINKTKDSIEKEGSKDPSTDPPQHPEPSPIIAGLRALKTELQVWLEQSSMLKVELQSRFSALCRMQEEISTRAAKEVAESLDSQLTPYQAAKFQGEVLNMKRENSKVESELQIGVDHIRRLLGEVEKELANLRVHLQLSAPRSSHTHQSTKNLSGRTRIPLRSFLFGTKPKKQSIFACMNPAFQRHYSDLRAAYQ